MATDSTIIRTFKQLGYVYDTLDNADGNVIVTLGGVEIYNGTVPYTGPPDGVSSLPLFEWTNTIDYMGESILTVVPVDCQITLSLTINNYAVDSGNAETFGQMDYLQLVDGETCQDPFTNVVVNDEPRQRGATLQGQWHWTIPDGFHFAATLNTEPGWL